MSFRLSQLSGAGLLVLAWIVAGAGRSPAQAPAPGAQAGASLWDGPAAAAAAPTAPGLEERMAALEKTAADLEQSVGVPRGLRSRQPLERRLEDLETRLDQLEKRLNDLEKRMKRAEQRK